MNDNTEDFIFGIDPPCKITSFIDTVIIIAYYVMLSFTISMILFIKHVKDNWPIYKCKTNYMFFADYFGYDAEVNFTECLQIMQTGFMDVLMEPANYLMSVITDSIGGLTNSFNLVRTFLDTFRINISEGIYNIFGVFLNMIIQVQMMVIKMKDMISKNIGIVTTSLYTLDTGVKTMQSTWNGPIGETIRAL